MRREINILDEGKLTPWAEKQLAIARSEKDGSYTSLGDLWEEK